MNLESIKAYVYELLKGAQNGNILTMVIMVNAHEFMKRQLQLSMIPSLITVKNNDLIGATLKELKIVVMTD